MNALLFLNTRTVQPLCASGPSSALRDRQTPCSTVKRWRLASKVSRRNELQSFFAKTSRDIYSIIQYVRIQLFSCPYSDDRGNPHYYRAVDAQTSLFRRGHRVVPAADLDRANPHTGPTVRRIPGAPRRDTGRFQRVRVVPSGRPRRVEERPPQQDDPAGERGQRRGRFLAGADHPARPAVSAARRQRRVLHHRIEHHRHAARAPRRVHPRQPPHPALPDHDRERPDHRAHAKLGRRAACLVRQHGNRPPGRRRSNAGSAVEQELRRLPRQPAGQPLPAGDARLRDRVFGLRHLVRAVSRPRQRARRPVSEWTRRSCRNRSRDRPSDPARSDPRAA